MKQKLKYTLLLAFTLLLHFIVTDAAECEHTTPSSVISQTEAQYFLSENCPVENAINRLFILYSNQSCELSYADIMHLPAAKSLQLLVVNIRTCKMFSKSQPTFSHHLLEYYSGAITHYIYRLKKIII